MLDPLDQNNRKHLGTLTNKRNRTFWVLTLKTFTIHIWRPVFWVILFCGLWMLEIPNFFGSAGTIATPILFIIGLIYLIKTDIASFKFPRARALDHALETSSHMPRGQITLIEDTLANPKKRETRALWNNAQQHTLQNLKSLKVPTPNLSLARQDPGAIRFIAVLIFFSGFMISGYDWQNKIINGLIPVAPSYVLGQGKATNLWIKPPSYTQLPQTHIIGTDVSEPLHIPEGSTVKVRTHSILGQSFPPHFQGKEMEYLDEGLYGAEITVQPGNALKITQSFIPRAHWVYDYIIDTPPEIALDQPAPKEDEETPQPYETTENGQIKVPLKLLDDYGVKDLRMSMNIDPMIEDKPLGESTSETRLIMSQPGTEFKVSPLYDLNWHTWAGLPVTFTFEAIDHKGQPTKLAPVNLTLPEREFEHPMAKSLITMRKKLAWEHDSPFDEIAFNLETLLSAPDYFQNKPAIYLAIKTAAARLRFNNNARPDERLTATKHVINLLWHTALAIEEGNLSLAMRELRDAQTALENALRDPNTTDDEIAALMEELRENMNNYFAEMQRDLQKRLENGEQFPEFSNEDFGQMISPDALSQMMEQIEQALREGDQAKAEELMAQLQRMMEMMDPSNSAGLPPDMQMMQDGVNELQELIERQEALLVQTQQQEQQQNRVERRERYKASPRELQTLDEMFQQFGLDGLPPAPEQAPQNPRKNPPHTKKDLNTAPNKAEQEALRFILGQLMLDAAEKIDEVPESMGLAEQEMRASSEKLGANNPRGSIPHQEQAIEYLKEAQEDLAQQFRQRMQQMIGIGLSGGQQRYDPLGRPLGDDPNGDRNHGSRIEIPDKAQKKRVDEILRELRDRLGDRSRPSDELEYYRRLLRQF